MTREENLTYLQVLQEKLERQNYRNPIYETFLDFRGRFAVLIGGSGSGKSYVAADKVIDRIIMEDNHRILCVRNERKQVSESQFPLLKSRLVTRYEFLHLNKKFKINESKGLESITYLENGNEIIFAGLDDVEKLKSIFDITSVWIEEADQINVSDLRELNRRLRGYQGKNKNGTDKHMQVILTFNPVSILSWLKKRFFDEKVENQIMLHGEQPFTDCIHYKDFKGSLETDVLVIHSTYKDNKFIDDSYDKEMQKLKNEDPEEFNIYCLGFWGLSGGTFFNKHSINKQIQKNNLPIKVGYFDFKYENHEIVKDSIKWIDDREGYIRIYEDVLKGFPYVGGGDSAGDGSDWNTGCFTNNITGEDVATLRVNFDEDLYARQMYCLGLYYNEALVGIETNFSTHPNKELERMNYPNLFIREQSPDAYTSKLANKYGFLTTKLTRPQALGMLRTIVREEPFKIKDLTLLLEMTTFVKNEKGRPEAMNGAHDDMVMARAINCYIASQQRNYPIVEKKEPNSVIWKHKKKLMKKKKRRNY